MAKVIITTVGTSLLNNLVRKENKKNFGFKISEEDAEDISNGELEEAFTELPEYCKTLISANDPDLKKVIYDKDYELNINASAEIKSICMIASGTPSTVYLLATDTFMSEYAAVQIAEYLNDKNGITVINKGRIQKLKINAPEEFEQSGFEELIKMLDSIRQSHEDDEVILNISGGYKALIPFLTIYAQLKSLAIKYIYENSEEVISIGNTPLDFDWEIIEQNYFALEKFGDKGDKVARLNDFKERLAEDKKSQDDLFIELEVKGIIVKVNEGEVRLTNLGSLYIQSYDEKFHSGTFHRKSLHSKLIEYMVFESFQSEYPGKTHIGYKPPNTDYDIDVFVETNDKIIAIEVKPAGNIPIKKRGKNSDVDTIEHKVSEGSFKHLIESHGKEKDIFFKYVCYGPLGIHPSPKRQIESLLEKIPQYDVPNEVKFELCYLKTPMNFKSNTNWRVDENHSIESLFSQSLRKTNSHV
jgi:CRISPR/Cas system-associated protein Csm6